MKQIKLFCGVAAAAADRVLVVTCDANCFPAFESTSAAYDETVRVLRRLLVLYSSLQGIYEVDECQTYCSINDFGMTWIHVLVYVCCNRQ